MSDALAIAAVSKTLKKILTDAVAAQVSNGSQSYGTPSYTTKALDKARTDDTVNQLNLFLYQVSASAHWKNTAPPGSLRSGESGAPPLGLHLHYLVTAYGAKDDDLLAHELLAIAMRAFQDNPVLTPTLIGQAYTESDLKHQLERVRLSHYPMPLEETSKLWSAFQTGYRLSACYEAAVVFVDGTRQSRTPLPVLERRTAAFASPEAPFPALLGLELPHGAASARLGDSIALLGRRLDGGATASVLLSSPRLRDAVGSDTVELVPSQRSPSRLEFVLPNDAEQWPAGVYGVAVSLRHPGESDRTTNVLALTVAPRISEITSVRSGVDLSVTLKVVPSCWPAQRAALLIGDREVLAEPPSETAREHLTFEVARHVPGSYFVRVRVDGVDSLLVDPTANPPAFDLSQRVVEP
jgi:hypothetical protein